MAPTPELTPAELRALPAPPDDRLLAALWWAARGEWDRAHHAVMDEDGADAAWVHAWLHRTEGDLPNARYWYGRAGQTAAAGPLTAEWDSIAAALLSRPS